eukprot:7077567-Prymnesium_polylepis.1
MTLRGDALRLEFYCLFFLFIAPPRGHHHRRHETLDGRTRLGCTTTMARSLWALSEKRKLL